MATASNSFTEEQVKILVFVLDTLLRGGDARMAVRHKAFNGLVAKAHRMREKLRKGQGGRRGRQKGNGDG